MAITWKTLELVLGRTTSFHWQDSRDLSVMCLSSIFGAIPKCKPSAYIAVKVDLSLMPVSIHRLSLFQYQMSSRNAACG
ncbi:hypothetical protein NPIL_353421 [Nephila pilipes]|uniref:Uncharacterized protein n=1 Tax=Nephila pilipes TaxID=299642 RepID=A0A8X6TY06_NEPPI|nr:hypothetical protein NPIL_353421 [Nephila pilipes]